MSKDLPIRRLESVGGDESLEERRVFKFSWRPVWLVLGSAAGLYLLVSAVNRSFNLLALGLFAVLCLPIAGYFASLALRVKLIIDRDGVTFHESGKSRRLDWGQIHGVSVGTAPGRPGVRHYRLFSLDQVVMEFENEIQESERAYRTIERRLAVSLYPQARATLDRGESVPFGAVSLSKHAVAIRHVSLPLTDARLVRTDAEVSLFRRGQPDPLVTVSTADVQNANLLFRCLSEVQPRALAA